MEWEDVKGYENLYKINRKGEVMRYGHILKQQLSREGYYYVRLSKDSVISKALIHRLLGLQYLDNPDNLPQIDHIDQDKTNNSLENLRWVSRQDNCLNRKNCVASLSEEQAKERLAKIRECQRVNKEKARQKAGIQPRLFLKDMTPEQILERQQRTRELNRLSREARKAKLNN